jgi:signal transduction histidine kinase
MPHRPSSPLCVLLVEDNETHAHLIERHIEKAGGGLVTLECVSRLERALERLDAGGIDALLLDLSLPDSTIDDTLPKVIGAHGGIPIIVLTSFDDLEFATRAVAQGAQDFLVKSDLNGPLLMRSINYAIERKKTQDRLESYAAELEISNAQLKGFAHTVAHEVKSPLTVVSVCLQVFDEHYRDELTAEHRELVSDAESALRGLTAMVNDLLEFSHAGSEQHEFELIDTEAAFFHAYVCLRPAIKESGAVVTHDSLPTAPGNEAQLRQLLLNLIGNAIKYCDKEAPEIHVSAERSDEGWRFSVRDNGLGIAAEDQQRIFDAFVRVHDQSRIQGSGIGLAFCKRIVENHSGRIWVESTPGQGSTFFFTLPAQGNENAA